jgi:hypothetical protein
MRARRFKNQARILNLFRLFIQSERLKRFKTTNRIHNCHLTSYSTGSGRSSAITNSGNGGREAGFLAFFQAYSNRQSAIILLHRGDELQLVVATARGLDFFIPPQRAEIRSHRSVSSISPSMSRITAAILVIRPMTPLYVANVSHHPGRHLAVYLL